MQEAQSASPGVAALPPGEHSSAAILPSYASQDTLASHDQSSPSEVAAGADSEIGDPNALEDVDDGVLPRIGYDSDTSADEEGEVLDARGRKRIRPKGDTFEGSNEILGNAHSILRRHYTGPWLSWRRVPDDPKQLFWDEFKNRYFWKDKHAQAVKRNWSAKCSQYLRSKFSEARGARTRPDFIDPGIWAEMLEKWRNSKSFQHQSGVNKRNRASEAPDGIGIFAGGSKSVDKHVAEYERKTGKRMSQEMLMKKTYKKRNGEWSSPRPQIALERFKVLCERYLESHPEGYTQEVVERLWLDAVGGRKNRRVFARGSFHRSVPNCRNPAALGPSQSLRIGNLNVNQMEELRKIVEEDVQKSMEERIQLLLMKQRQEDAAAFQSMLDLQLSRYVHPNPQTGTSLQPHPNPQAGTSLQPHPNPQAGISLQPHPNPQAGTSFQPHPNPQAGISLQPLMNSSANLYASPSCPFGSFAPRPSIMNTSFTAQPTYMEQLQMAHPFVDTSLIGTSRLSQVGTTYLATGGSFGGDVGRIGGSNSG